MPRCELDRLAAEFLATIAGGYLPVRLSDPVYVLSCWFPREPGDVVVSDNPEEDGRNEPETGAAQIRRIFSAPYNAAWFTVTASSEAALFEEVEKLKALEPKSASALSLPNMFGFRDTWESLLKSRRTIRFNGEWLYVDRTLDGVLRRKIRPYDGGPNIVNTDEEVYVFYYPEESEREGIIIPYGFIGSALSPPVPIVEATEEALREAVLKISRSLGAPAPWEEGLTVKAIPFREFVGYYPCMMLEGETVVFHSSQIVDAKGNLVATFPGDPTGGSVENFVEFPGDPEEALLSRLDNPLRETAETANLSEDEIKRILEADRSAWGTQVGDDGEIVLPPDMVVYLLQFPDGRALSSPEGLILFSDAYKALRFFQYGKGGVAECRARREEVLIRPTRIKHLFEAKEFRFCIDYTGYNFKGGAQ
jgi:hypothetical protein